MTHVGGCLPNHWKSLGRLLASGIRAGVAYGATVFAVGFLLGTARILLLAPRVGAAAAVSIEAPIIMTASWYVSRFWMARLAIRADIGLRILAGAVAFATLQILEVTLAIGLFRRSMGAYLADLSSTAGAIGLAAQICVATFPLLITVMSRRARRSAGAPLESTRVES